MRTLLESMSITKIHFHCLMTATNLIKPLIDTYGNRHTINIIQQKQLWNEKYYENNNILFDLIIVLDRLPEQLKKAKLESNTIKIQICDYIGKYKKMNKCIICNNYSSKRSVCGLRYCSEECQKINWKSHKKICQCCIDKNTHLKFSMSIHNH